jgi:hypothetical protein
MFLSCITAASLAQPTPQYSMMAAAPTFSNSTPLDFKSGRRVQNLYKPSEFPGASYGMVTAIYFKTDNYLATNISYRNFVIRAAYMPAEQGNGNEDTFIHSVYPYQWYDTDTIFYSASYTLPNPTDSNTWLKFTLQKPFLFDGIHNFIIDMAHDSGTVQPPNLLRLRAYSMQQQYRGYSAGANPNFSSAWINPLMISAVNVIGFDIQPLGVEGLSKLQSVKIYPNPNEGRFIVSFNASKKVKNLSINITTMTGASVISEHHGDVSGSFKKELDLSRMAKGVYFLELNADGERAVRKVVVE